jgi:hypothetical protein
MDINNINIENEIDIIIAATTQDMATGTVNTANTDHNTGNSDNSDNNATDGDTTQIEYPAIDEESTQVFNMSLQQYLTIDDEKTVLQDTLRKKNNQKKNYEQTMLAYLSNYNIKNVSLDGSYKNRVLETETKNVASGFNRSTVIEVLEECLGSDSELFDTIMLKLSERVAIKEVTKLKLLDLSKKRVLKKDKIANNNQMVESILDTTETVIPENLRYLFTEQ